MWISKVHEVKKHQKQHLLLFSQHFVAIGHTVAKIWSKFHPYSAVTPKGYLQNGHENNLSIEMCTNDFHKYPNFFTEPDFNK